MEREQRGPAELEVERSELTAVLAGRMRRDVIDSLQDADVPLSLADLAVALAREDVDTEEEAWTRAECYWIKLFHNHVPTLEEAGLVEYDRDRRTISLSPSVTDGTIDEEAFAAMETDLERLSTAE